MSRSLAPNRTTAVSSAQYGHNGDRNTHQDLYEVAPQAARDQYNAAIRVAQDRYNADVRAAQQLLFTDNGTSAHRQETWPLKLIDSDVVDMAQADYSGFSDGIDAGIQQPGDDMRADAKTYGPKTIPGEYNGHTSGSASDSMAVADDENEYNMQPFDLFAHPTRDMLIANSHLEDNIQDGEGALPSLFEVDKAALAAYRQYILSCLQPEVINIITRFTFSWPGRFHSLDILVPTTYCTAWNEKDSNVLLFLIEVCKLSWGLVTSLFFPGRVLLECKTQYYCVTNNMERAELDGSDYIMRDEDMRPPEHCSKDLPQALDLGTEVEQVFANIMMFHRMENHRLHLVESLPIEDTAKVALLSGINQQGWPKHLHTTGEFCKPLVAVGTTLPDKDKDFLLLIRSCTSLTYAQTKTAFFPNRSVDTLKKALSFFPEAHRRLNKRAKATGKGRPDLQGLKKPTLWSIAEQRILLDASHARLNRQQLMKQLPGRSAQAISNMADRLKKKKISLQSDVDLATTLSTNMDLDLTNPTSPDLEEDHFNHQPLGQGCHYDMLGMDVQGAFDFGDNDFNTDFNNDFTESFSSPWDEEHFSNMPEDGINRTHDDMGDMDEEDARQCDSDHHTSEATNH